MLTSYMYRTMYQYHAKKRVLPSKERLPLLMSISSPSLVGMAEHNCPALTVIYDRQFSWLRFIMHARLPGNQLQ